jgi:hypothetical protein
MFILSHQVRSVSCDFDHRVESLETLERRLGAIGADAVVRRQELRTQVVLAQRLVIHDLKKNNLRVKKLQNNNCFFKVIQRIWLAPSKFNNQPQSLYMYNKYYKPKLSIFILNVMLNAKFCHRKEQFGN